MTSDPHWTAYLTALLTPVIAVLGTYIAYQQWQINRHKLRLDLFERRWAIYAATNDVLAVLINGSDDDRRTCIKNFRRRLMDARFLCARNTIEFLERVDKRITGVVEAERTLRNVAPESTERKSVERRVVDETEGCRAAHNDLVLIFSDELRINF